MHGHSNAARLWRPTETLLTYSWRLKILQPSCGETISSLSSSKQLRFLTTHAHTNPWALTQLKVCLFQHLSIQRVTEDTTNTYINILYMPLVTPLTVATPLHKTTKKGVSELTLHLKELEPGIFE